MFLLQLLKIDFTTMQRRKFPKNHGKTHAVDMDSCGLCRHQWTSVDFVDMLIQSFTSTKSTCASTSVH